MKQLQDTFAEEGSPLEQRDLDVAISVVKEVGKRYSGEENDLHDFKAPDITGRMRYISELTAGDPGTTETDLMILHHGVPLDTVKQLNLATFNDRYLEQLNDPSYEGELAQNSPVAFIEDVLRKSSTSSIFKEYLANAEDCGSATRICWILDETKDYPTTGLLSELLARVHGPALFCYNDGGRLFFRSEAGAGNLILISIGSQNFRHTISGASQISELGRSRAIPQRSGNLGEGH